MKVRWRPGAKGHEDRVSVCGTYVIEMTAMGCRHEPGPFWGCRLATVDDDNHWLGSDGARTSRSRYGGVSIPEGTMREAKADAQAHADLGAPLTWEEAVTLCETLAVGTRLRRMNHTDRRTLLHVRAVVDGRPVVRSWSGFKQRWYYEIIHPVSFLAGFITVEGRNGP